MQSPETLQQTMPASPAPEWQKIAGHYFDGQSSRSHPASVCLHAGLLTLHYQAPAQSVQRSFEAKDYSIEPPLGKIRRVIKFNDGGRFESDQLSEFAALEKQLGRNRGLSVVNWLESSWQWALGSVLATVLFVVMFFAYGLPAIANAAAQASPRDFLASLDEQAIELLDNGQYMSQSKLSKARQNEIQRQFKAVKDWAGNDYPYRLLLRNGVPQESGGMALGANAFALPNGTLVMTDQLIALSKSDKELMGVLAHEVGHVKHRHALASIYRAAGIGAMTVALTGDLVSTSTMVAAVPLALLNNGYSRQAETESDDLAGEYMMQTFGTTKPLRDLLARLETDDKDANEHSVTEDEGAEEFLMTHPGTKRRIEQLRSIEASAQENAAPLP